MAGYDKCSALGRFISPDSILPDPGNPVAWDRYAYALNSPSRYTDPSGHLVCSDRHVANGIVVIKLVFQDLGLLFRILLNRLIFRRYGQR
jgi:hypothetical protein